MCFRCSYMHPKSWYGELKGESPDLVRYLPSGSKTIFREFFWPATLKISSFLIYWIRLVWKSLISSSNLSDMRVKSALWVPQIGVRHEINTFWQSIHLKFIRAWTWCGSHVDWRDGDWRTICEHFCVPQAFWAWGFLKMIWYQTKHTQNIDIRI